MVIAAHPSDSGQFALGMSDGAVYVIKSLAAEQKWVAWSLKIMGALRSNPSSSALNGQPSEASSR